MCQCLYRNLNGTMNIREPILCVSFIPHMGAVGVTLYIFICLGLPEQQNGSPNVCCHSIVHDTCKGGISASAIRRLCRFILFF